MARRSKRLLSLAFMVLLGAAAAAGPLLQTSEHWPNGVDPMEGALDPPRERPPMTGGRDSKTFEQEKEEITDFESSAAKLVRLPPAPPSPRHKPAAPAACPPRYAAVCPCALNSGRSIAICTTSHCTAARRLTPPGAGFCATCSGL